MKGPPPEHLLMLREAARQELARAAGVDSDQAGSGSPEAPGTLASTIERYNYQGKVLLKRYMREMEIPLDTPGYVDPESFVDWFLAQKTGYKPSTWRHYRRAVITVVEANPHDNREAALSRLSFDVDEVRSGDEYKRRKAAAQESGESGSRSYREKLKFIPDQDFYRICFAAGQSLKSSQLGGDLKDWLKAGVKTGLRPSEWKATSVVQETDPEAFLERRIYLYVINAKNTNGRSNGVVRTLDLTAMTDDDVVTIMRHSDRAARKYREGAFDEWMKSCSKLLERICDRMYRKKGETRASRSYSLYALRHQFIANMKDSYPDNPEWVSAMAGHSVVETAKSHYAKRRSSWAPDKIGPLPRPVDEEVATIRRQHNIRDRIQAIRDFKMPSEMSGGVAT